MESLVYEFDAMACECAAHLCAETTQELRRFADAAEAEVRRIESRYSRYRPGSELARINMVARTGGGADVDPETAGLIAYAKACFAKSHGAFDISSGLLRAAWDFSVARLPEQAAIDALLPRVGLDHVGISDGRLQFGRAGMELDFGGLGKEYAADRAAEVCHDLGARHGFIDLAGDIRVIGPQPDGQPWIIGIRHPRDTHGIVAQIALDRGALATSGDYERFIEVDGRRYGHILDPRTGWPNPGLASVTVIAERCLVAGSLATAAMAMGTAGAAWLRRLGVRHLAIDDNGDVTGTEPVRLRP